MNLISRIDRKNNPSIDETASLAMCIAAWTVPSMVFKTVLDLKVFDIIHGAGATAQLSASDIASKLPTKNPNAAVVLDRLLRLLASFEVLKFSSRVGSDGRVELLYGLGPACEFLVNNESEGSFVGFADFMHHKILMDTWKHLKDAILEGKIPFNRAYGMGIYDYLAIDSKFRKVFYNGVNNYSTIVVKEILDKYRGFEGISSLVDVGGAGGLALSMIVKKYPNIKGINFDMPLVIKDAPSIPGVEHVGGDMRVSVPNADAVFIKATFLNENDENCIQLLKNCHKALPDEGKVIICENIAPELPENSPLAHIGFILDAIMFAFPGGKVRTKKEYETLGKQAGFQDFRLVCYACGACVMEYVKKA